MIGPLRSALRIVLAQISLRSHLRHGRFLLLEDGRNVQECVRHETAQLRLMWFKKQEIGRLDGLERTGYSRPGSQLTGFLGRLIGYAVVWIERVFFGVREQHGWLEVT